MNKTRLITFCGAAASGKTTLSKKIAEEHNAIRLSFDELQCLQHKDLLSHIKKALTEGKCVVVDALFPCVSQRKMLLDAINDTECKRILIYMNTPLDECIRRNAQRKNPLPEFVIESIYKSLEFPEPSEGWDEIVYVEV